jgi:hypothetical protein
MFLNKGKYIHITLRFENKFLGTKIAKLKGTLKPRQYMGMVTEHDMIYYSLDFK